MATPIYFCGHPSRAKKRYDNDNIATLAVAKDPKYHEKIKCIKTRYHYIRDSITEKDAVLKYISTSNMVADPLTKPIARDVFVKHVRSLGLCRM